MTIACHKMLDLGSVSVPNFSQMVAILVRHCVPILDNGGTGLIPDPKGFIDKVFLWIRDQVLLAVGY